MDSWDSVIGNFPALKTPSILAKLAVIVYKTALAKRDQIWNSELIVNPDKKNPHNKFLSLKEEQNIASDKSRTRPTYKHVFITKEKYIEAGEEKVREIERTEIKNKGKWITINMEMKFALRFLFMRYVKEIYDYCVENAFTFTGPDIVTTIDKYYMDLSEGGIFSFIIRTTDLIDALPGNYESTCNDIHNKIATILDNKAITTVSLAERFINFVKIIGMLIADITYYQRRRADFGLLCAVLRIMSTFTTNNVDLDEDIVHKMHEYAIYSKEQHDNKRNAKKKVNESRVDELLKALNDSNNLEDSDNEPLENPSEVSLEDDDMIARMLNDDEE